MFRLSSGLYTRAHRSVPDNNHNSYYLDAVQQTEQVYDEPYDIQNRQTELEGCTMN